jgi:signal transduction histidine kinase/CheY-like chemotaxis protein
MEPQRQQQQMEAQVQWCDLLTDPNASVQDILHRAALLIPILLRGEIPTSTSTGSSFCRARISLFDYHNACLLAAGPKNQHDTVTTCTEFWSDDRNEDKDNYSNTMDGFGPGFGTESFRHTQAPWLSTPIPVPKSRVQDQDPAGETTAETAWHIGRIDIFQIGDLCSMRLAKKRADLKHVQTLANQLGRVVTNGWTLQKNRLDLKTLQEKHRRLAESQHLAKIGQWELDLVNNALFWSDAVYEIFRIDPTEFGASYEAFLDAIHPDDRKFVNDAYTNSLKTKKPYNIIHRLLFESSKEDDTEPQILWVNEICRTEYHPITGLPLYSVGIVQDITELKTAQEMDRLKSAFLANMSHEIRTPLNAIMGYTDLILMEPEVLSHQNREYLRTIRQSGELLMAVVSDILDISKIEAGQLQVDCKPYSPLDILEIVGNNAKAYQANVVGQNVKLELCPDWHDVGRASQQTQVEHGDIREVLVLGDPARLRQVLDNLVNNALKFTGVKGGTNGRVEYGVRLVGPDSADAIAGGFGPTKMLEFYVSDNGVGIPEENQNSIFEAFHQVHPSRDSHELGGTGLGLTISKRLVELMGGEMRLWSSTHTVHHGTTVYFTLPYKRVYATPADDTNPRNCGALKQMDKSIDDHHINNRTLRSRTSLGALTTTTDAPAAVPAVRTEQSERAPHPSPPSKHKVLVVDDNKVNLKLAVRMVNKLGYETATAMNGEEAVDQFRSDPSIRFILMDKEMYVRMLLLGIALALNKTRSPSHVVVFIHRPVMDGLQAVREIRRLERDKGKIKLSEDVCPVSSIPVVALTAAAYREDEEACLKAGCDHYLTKPVKREALESILASYLRMDCQDA